MANDDSRRYRRNQRSNDDSDYPDTSNRRCTCNLNLAARMNQDLSSSHVSFGKDKRTRTVNAQAAPNTSYGRAGDDSGVKTMSDGPKVIVYPKVCDPDETTVIQLPPEQQDDKAGTYVVGGSSKILIDYKGSQVSITPRSRGKRNAADVCINPSECGRMQGMTDRSDPRQDQLRLESALKEALDSYANSKTFDDMEELMEIYSCNEIQRRLQALVQEKRDKLQKREARREAELLNRKMDFHKNLIQRISDDRREQSKMHQDLLKLLEEQSSGPAGNDSSDDIQLTLAHQFQPQGESTRMRDGDSNRQDSLKIKIRQERNAPRGRSCSCRSDQLMTDQSDEPTSRRR